MQCAKDIMRTKLVSIHPDAGLDRALVMMRTKRIRHLPVIDSDKKVVGILAERDLRLNMVEMEHGPDQSPKGMYLPALKKVKDAMISTVIACNAEDSLQSIVDKMCTHKIGCVPVINEQSRELVGIVAESDLLRLLRDLLNAQTDA